MTDKKPLLTFRMQLSGSNCMISCQTLARNDLYVYAPLFSFSFLSCINDLDSFGSTFQKLYSFQHYVLNIAADLKKKTDKKLSITKSFRSQSSSYSSASSVMEWRRDTFYTPPQNKKPRYRCTFLVLLAAFSSLVWSKQNTQKAHQMWTITNLDNRARKTTTNSTTRSLMKWEIKIHMTIEDGIAKFLFSCNLPFAILYILGSKIFVLAQVVWFVSSITLLRRMESLFRNW